MHPVLLKIGSITIGSYAFMLTLAFLTGMLVAARRGRRYGIPVHEAANVVTLVILSSMAGSRILFILENFQSYFNAPASALEVWKGGFSYHGGLLLAIAAVLLWCRRRGISFGAVLDTFAPVVALGFVIVRTGCFLNGCCFGTPTDLPWGVSFPLGSPAGAVYGAVRIHPTQLYEALCGLITFLALVRLERRPRFSRGDGMLFLSFLALSALWRFGIEFLRYHEPASMTVGGFSAAQVYSIGILVSASAVMAAICSRHPDRDFSH